jgi:hypothetical protein
MNAGAPTISVQDCAQPACSAVEASDAHLSLIRYLMHGKHRLGIGRRARLTLPLRRFPHEEGVLVE